VLNCSVSYDGVAQIHWWLADPTQAQNPRRAVYESFDPKLETLRNIVGAAQSRGQAARDLEAAVAWLLWMPFVDGYEVGPVLQVNDDI
jgi:hypothetical protein